MFQLLVSADHKGSISLERQKGPLDLSSYPRDNTV